MPLAASVLIDGPSELVFDYAIPDHLEVLPGCRVRIPLRNRDATGTVLRIQEAPQSEFDLRFLTGLVDPEPLITPALLKLAEWITSYYGTPLEQVIRSIIPASIRGEKTSAQKTTVVFTTPRFSTSVATHWCPLRVLENDVLVGGDSFYSICVFLLFRGIRIPNYAE